MTKTFKVLGAELEEDKPVELPDDAIPLNVFYSYPSGKMILACLQPVEATPLAGSEVIEGKEGNNATTTEKTGSPITE